MIRLVFYSRYFLIVHSRIADDRYPKTMKLYLDNKIFEILLFQGCTYLIKNKNIVNVMLPWVVAFQTAG